MSSFDANVFIDTDALMSWETELKNINTAFVNIIGIMETRLNELEHDFKGNSADSFSREVHSCINEAKTYHEKMNDISSFLQLVVETMQEQ